MTAPVLDSSQYGDADFEVTDLTCKSDDPPQEPEVLVDVWNGDNEFVRIPTTQVELWINKDGPADINRTAKVEFPAEWGGVDIQQFINGFNLRPDGSLKIGDVDQDSAPWRKRQAFRKTFNIPSNTAEYDLCRIWFYDRTIDAYQITHFGYVGGVGPASDTGVFKFWVYDPADLMSRIPVSQSWASPTIAQLLNWALRGTDDGGDKIGIENRTVFGKLAPLRTTLLGTAEVKQQKREQADLGQDVTDDTDRSLTIFGIDAVDIVDDALDILFGTEVTSGLVRGNQSFKRNRHTTADVLNWFADRVGGKWHFEPMPSGPVLTFDNTTAPSTPGEDDTEMKRREFIDRTIATSVDSNPQPVAEAEDLIEKDVFDTVTTIENEALYDIKPLNTFTLFGEGKPTSDYQGNVPPTAAPAVSNLPEAAAASAFGEAFPKVKIRYPPLIDRAGGYEYDKQVESNETDLEAAEQAAKKKFREALQEETEGQMVIKGEPYILPFDAITNVPVCEGQMPNVNVRPIRYEVNSVKHTRSAGERFTTTLGVSIIINEQIINENTESEYVPL